MPQNSFGAGAPILRVANARVSRDYYIEQLGFSVEWDEGEMASVRRDACTIFLCEYDQGQRGTWIWIGVPDANALHEELVARRARIRQGPTNFPWALEIQVEDPDGNVMRFGSDSLPNVPYGRFLDAGNIEWDFSGTA